MAKSFREVRKKLPLCFSLRKFVFDKIDEILCRSICFICTLLFVSEKVHDQGGSVRDDGGPYFVYNGKEYYWSVVVYIFRVVLYRSTRIPFSIHGL